MDKVKHTVVDMVTLDVTHNYECWEAPPGSGWAKVNQRPATAYKNPTCSQRPAIAFEKPTPAQRTMPEAPM